MEVLVGKPGAGQSTAPQTPPILPPSTAFGASNTLSGQTPGPQSIALPPTLPPDLSEPAAGAPVDAAAGAAHAVLASAPLGADQAALQPMALAAKRAAAQPDARFVVLVLTAPAKDVAALKRNAERSQQAASAAMQALNTAGIDSSRIEISSATNNAAPGDGEIRLYTR